MKKLLFKSIIAITLLLLLELLLRITYIGTTYSEKTQGQFVTYYNQHLPTWYHVWGTDRPIVYDEPEIKCSYPTNRLGLREVNLPNDRPDNVKRLMVIGDSFVEGYGVEYPFSMPRFLEKKLDSAKLSYQVYDAGVCGSDPFYEYTLLRDKLLALHPTHVVLVFNASDINDCIFRGGMERFQKDGTTIYKKSNWLLPFYSHSYIIRLLCNNYGMDETLLTPAQKTKAVKKAMDQIYSLCLKDIKPLCDQANIKFAIVVHPFPSTFNHNPITDEINDFANQYPNDSIHLVSTFKDFSQYLNKETYLTYSLKLNGHFNTKGYQLFADILFKDINQQYPNFWQ